MVQVHCCGIITHHYQKVVAVSGDAQGSTTEGTVVAMNTADFWKVKVAVGALEGACIVLFTSWASPFNIRSGMISGLNINIDITSTPH